jgi:L-alanine-DL-glutamate epimerase-like enolase superfamily enzyme
MPALHIRRLTFETLTIPFKVAFRHASAERAETSSAWVTAESDDGAAGHGESCPRPYVTGETIERARRFFDLHEPSIRASVVDLESLRAWTAGRQEDLDAEPAAWCAIELAVLDLIAQRAGVTIEGLLGTPPVEGRFQYSAVVGDMAPDAFRATAERYRAQGFTDFKVKLSGDLARDRAKVEVLRPWSEIRVRVDANNLWQSGEEAAAFLESLAYPFFAIEEPIGTDYHALATLARRLGCRIVLDESLLRASQVAELPGSSDLWLVNLRVSKMGGLLRSLGVVEAARRAGVRLIVGAQVGETSLLTRAALTVASVARDLLIAQEGAFGTHLLERDVCDPPLMFGADGVLDAAAFPALTRPGLGLSWRTPEAS